MTSRTGTDTRASADGRASPGRPLTETTARRVSCAAAASSAAAADVPSAAQPTGRPVRSRSQSQAAPRRRASMTTSKTLRLSAGRPACHRLSVKVPRPARCKAAAESCQSRSPVSRTTPRAATGTASRPVSSADPAGTVTAWSRDAGRRRAGSMAGEPTAVVARTSFRATWPASWRSRPCAAITVRSTSTGRWVGPSVWVW